MIQKFQMGSLLSSEELPDHMFRMNYVLKGVWISMLSMGYKFSEGSSFGKYEIPFQLVDLLIAEKMNKPLKWVFF